MSLIDKGTFYFIIDSPDSYIVEDKTKRGLSVQDTSIDEKAGVKADKGIIRDMDGRGHPVSVRWYFSKDRQGKDAATKYAHTIEDMYLKMRELTCPDK